MLESFISKQFHKTLQTSITGRAVSAQNRLTAGLGPGSLHHTPLAGFKGRTSKGGEEGKGRLGEEGREGRKKGEEGREGEGIRRTNAKLFATRLKLTAIPLRYQYHLT